MSSLNDFIRCISLKFYSIKTPAMTYSIEVEEISENKIILKHGEN